MIISMLTLNHQVYIQTGFDASYIAAFSEEYTPLEAEKSLLTLYRGSHWHIKIPHSLISKNTYIQSPSCSNKCAALIIGVLIILPLKML